MTTWQGGTSSHILKIGQKSEAILFSSSVSDVHIKSVSNKIVHVLIRRASDGKILVKDKFSVEVGEFEGRHRISEQGVIVYEMIDSHSEKVIFSKSYHNTLPNQQ